MGGLPAFIVYWQLIYLADSPTGRTALCNDAAFWPPPWTLAASPHTSPVDLCRIRMMFDQLFECYFT